MFKSASHIVHLLKAARVLAARDAFLTTEQAARLPAPARLALAALRLGGAKPGEAGPNRLAEALTRLGPSYVKLGQFLATRPDIIGPARAGELTALQDAMAPFAQDEARAIIAAELDRPVDALFAEFSPPVAAASIAQVHRARLKADGRQVAVKVLRPGIRRRFARDIEAFAFAARLLERLDPEARRLRPVDAVATLKRSVDLEMDLRMEAAAIREMAENSRSDPDIMIPEVIWPLTTKRILCLEWIDGIALSDLSAIAKSEHDPVRLGDMVIQTFLRHAIRDGFFHADMHPGNLFVLADGRLAAVDFGIMGRLAPGDRLFLAEILHGFITGNYTRVAEVHFEAGYVPDHQQVAEFAQALRAIGEPLLDRKAEDISMARLLAQLFEVTEQFDMKTQPQLLLLQKTMVVVEGVARSLNPKLNMWATAEPVVRQWMEQRLGPQGRIEDAAEGMATLARLAGELPDTLGELQKAAAAFARLGRGARSTETANPQGAAAPLPGHVKAAIWLSATALAVIALAQVW